jgi:hypothetical protein
VIVAEAARVAISVSYFDDKLILYNLSVFSGASSFLKSADMAPSSGVWAPIAMRVLK